MVSLGFEPGPAGWYAQTKPRSYGGHPIKVFCFSFLCTSSQVNLPHCQSCCSSPSTKVLHAIGQYHKHVLIVNLPLKTNACMNLLRSTIKRVLWERINVNKLEIKNFPLKRFYKTLRYQTLKSTGQTHLFTFGFTSEFADDLSTLVCHYSQKNHFFSYIPTMYLK